MTKKHTPGPWIYSYNALGELSVESNNAESGFYRITVLGVEPDTTEEDEANARLIAEAPNLLKELKRLTATDGCHYDQLNPCWNNRPTDIPGRHWGGGNACPICSALAAIAKVEG